MGIQPSIREVVEVEPGQAYGEVEIIPFRAPFWQGGAQYLKTCVQQGWVDLVAVFLRGHRLRES